MSKVHAARRLGSFFKLGYVCRDFEGAMKSFGERRGVVEWARMEGPMLNFGRTVPIQIALAYSGPVQVELIQAPEDVPTVYSHAILADPLSARLHHIGYLVDDADEWNVVHEQMKIDGIPLLAGASLEMVQYCYFDSRADTGHISEYVWPREGMLAFFDSLPRNP